MARTPSKILTATELREQKKALKHEINGHAVLAKAAARTIKDATKAFAQVEKTAEATMAAAVKASAATVKVARKEYEAVLKAQTKAVEVSTKLGVKAEAKAAALVPKAATPDLVTATA